jgi:hypothetical protein
MLVRVREEQKAAGDSKVKALIVPHQQPGGTVTASDIIFRELQSYKRTSGVRSSPPDGRRSLRRATTSRSPPTRSSRIRPR